VDGDDEYLQFCGTEALGRLVCEQPENRRLVELLRRQATSKSWRVREAVARALQIVGDDDRTRMSTIVAEWTEDAEPYVRRAAVAGICEPRLLVDPATCAAALDACARTTASIIALPVTTRSDPGVRNLRQALGYCWSVAVAAAPESGAHAFAGIAAMADPDAQWIATSNLKKARLRQSIGSREFPRQGFMAPRNGEAVMPSAERGSGSA
jgi:hypothetical protein